MLIAKCNSCKSDWRVSSVEPGARCPQCQSSSVLYQSVLGKTIRIKADDSNFLPDDSIEDISPGTEQIPSGLKVSLTVAKGENLHTCFELHRSRTTFGRGASDIDVHDPHCSRRHMAVEIDPDGVIRIKDLASTNGTFLNGERVTDSPLKNDDVLKLGDTELKLSISSGD